MEMRILILAIVFGSSAMTTAWAQTSNDAHPWRKTNEPGSVSGSPNSFLIPNAPNMERKNLFAQSKIAAPTTPATQSQNPRAWPGPFRTANTTVGHTLLDSNYQQQDPGIVPRDYDLGTVPAAPEQSAVPDESASPLSVESNALASEPDYCCNCPGRCCRVGCPKKLLGRHRSGTDIGGWAQFGYHNRDTILFNDRKGTVNPHQLWMFFDKPATRHKGLGFRLDFLYGIDGQDLQAFGNGPVAGVPDGWDNDWDHGGTYGWAATQAYVELGNCCNTLRIGKFLTPFGYESAMSRENFFYSHSYTRVLTEPFSATGAIAEFRRDRQTSFILGATAGWDTGYDSVDNGFSVITGFRFNLNPDVAISTTSSWGDTGYRGSGVLNSLIADVRLMPRVNYVLQMDVLDLNLDDNNEFSLVNYLFYNISPCLAYGTRLEWWKSDRLFVDTKSTWEWTLGANYMPTTNIVLRPEVRIDWGAAAIDPGAWIIGIDGIVAF